MKVIVFVLHVYGPNGFTHLLTHPTMEGCEETRLIVTKIVDQPELTFVCVPEVLE
jgi:hypothetical protein